MSKDPKIKLQRIKKIKRAPLWKPIFTGVVVIVASLCLWRSLLDEERVKIERTIESGAIGIKDEIDSRMESRIRALVEVTRRGESSQKQLKEVWESDLWLMLDYLTSCQAIGWLDITLTPQWILPLVEDQAVHHLDFTVDPSERIALEAARERREITVLRSNAPALSGNGFLVFVPIYVGEEFGGFIVGAYRLKEFFETLIENVSPHYSLAIYDGEQEIYVREIGAGTVERQWTQEAAVTFHNLRWRLRVWPSLELVARSKSPIPKVILGVGILMALLLALSIHFAQQARLRSKMIESANRELERLLEERTRMTEELRAAKEGAEQASQAKSNFLASMSHELRTPLNAIIGFSEVLKEESFGPLNEKQKEYITDVCDSGKHLLSLINDILDLSKVEAGKMELELGELDLKSTLQRCLVMIKERTIRHHIQVSAVIDEGISTVTVDERKIKQVLFNLLSNAAKFTPDGGEIEVHAGRNGKEEVLVSVRDSGIGIEEKDYPKVFMEFGQIDSTYARKYAGTGLGLALTKKFVELHGGKIWFESTGKNKGTCFYFTLPVRRGAVREKVTGREGASRKEEAAASIRRDHNLVLVVEDDPKAAKLLATYLVQAGYSVEVARDGEEGVKKARALQPTLITLDVMMPKRDGWDVLCDLKMDPATKAIPIVIISILEEKGKGMALGATEYLTKPVSKEDLYHVIERLGLDARKKAEEIKILAVDDSPKDIELMDAILSPRGYKVLKATGGKEGIRLAESEHPDLILLDLMMPEVTGFDVLNELRNRPATKDIPVVIVTVKYLTDEDKRLLEGRVDAVIQKAGFDSQFFMREVSRVLARNGVAV